MQRAAIENSVIDLAKQLGFVLHFHKPQNCLLRFRRDYYTVDVWYSKMTVGISEHYEGRKHDRYHFKVSESDLTEILANPSYRP